VCVRMHIYIYIYRYINGLDMNVVAWVYVCVNLYVCMRMHIYIYTYI